MELTELTIWGDIGYTEGGYDVPMPGAAVSAAMICQLTDLYVPRGSLFSEIRIPKGYADLQNATYLRALYLDNAGNVITRYGWIDSVSMISDDHEGEVTSVRWHVDMWRTYAASCPIQDAYVLRMPLEPGAVPVRPQEQPHRWVERDSDRDVMLCDVTDGIWWVYFTFSAEDSSGAVVRIVKGVFPVSSDDTAVALDARGTKAPSASQVISGTWVAALKLDPARIYGAFICPVAPQVMHQPFDPPDGWTVVTSGPQTDGYYQCATIDAFKDQSMAIPSRPVTTDTETYVVTGFDGECLGVLPWGIPVAAVHTHVIQDATSAYVQVRCNSRQASQRAMGMSFTIPMIPLSVTENSWATYNYSQSRDADMRNRQVQSDAQLRAGLVGAASSAVNGAMIGGISGGGLGAAGGAILSGVTSAVTAGVTHDYQINELNPALQDIADTRHAHQADGLLMSGTGLDCLRFGEAAPKATCVQWDGVSRAAYAEAMAHEGQTVRQWMSGGVDLTAGPWRITNIRFGASDAPAEARLFVQRELARGVRLT